MAKSIDLVKKHITEEVFTRLQSPDRGTRDAAWEEVFPVLQQIVFGLLSRKWDADLDLINDLRDKVIFKFFEHVEKFEYVNAHALMSWIYLITDNALKNEFRNTSRNPKTPLEDAHLNQRGPDLHPLETSYVEKIVDQEAWQVIARAMENLNDDQRKVLVLHYWQGLSTKKVAEYMKEQKRKYQTDGAVKSVLHRIKDLMRGQIPGELLTD
jgi:RNA polymerase sigma factor (sigma-70 family)